ncbi:ribbon-helix-helix domain-containing protein [Albidovulum sp.]
MSRPVKRSLTLNGHRTSVSLEDEFWRAFRAAAARRGQPLNALAAEIDAARGIRTGLATAIRLFVLRDLQQRLAEAGGGGADAQCRTGSSRSG